MSIGIREFQTIAGAYGLAQAEQCAAGACTHTHREPAPAGPFEAGEPTAGGGLVDLRCPETMSKLLGRTRAVALPGGMVALACNNCLRRFRRDITGTVALVVHRYNLLGELLGTDISVTGGDPPAPGAERR